ncbi:SDR family oxidoreductase [Mesorhizobium tianshanense]|uniref:NAD(P)-dependent dehydrogenase (Short-subunit alcohol dehydrogenase family) n=1 Tax=Mesorhizobium tianshanense TaxID=39844 RepID=A0A562N3V1_9HYPH|nr:SDR family oxidoreductase [Mesorhizobium tianshanense]TWI26824.1 NAD(P)-dependent dehydrogenase (short-subunit alcohol dehydrogenase family) [Mesorhizobium tianshanense]
MNQRVMITAGGSGIGLVIAKSFIGNGAKVHICDVSERALADVAANYPQIAATHLNVTDEKAVRRWFDDAMSDLNGLDVLINNAGTKGPTGYVEDLKLDEWNACLSVCLDAQFLCARSAAPIMKSQRSGSIINMSSNAGLYGYGLRTPYAAAKWAVIGFTKSLAVELGPYDVRANAICPGSVEGARVEEVARAEAASRGISIEAVHHEYLQGQSIKRFVQPQEVADMCLFLASPASKMVTGQAIAVDGHTETFHIGN